MCLTRSYPAARTPITDAAPLPLKNVLSDRTATYIPLFAPPPPKSNLSCSDAAVGRGTLCLQTEDSECLQFRTRPQTLQRPLRPQRFSAPEMKPCRVATVKHDVTQTCASRCQDSLREVKNYLRSLRCTFRLQRRKSGTVFILLISKCITLCNTDAS